MSETLPAPEIRPELQQTLQFVERIIETGDWTYPEDDPIAPPEAFTGLVLDENDQSITDYERHYLSSWLEQKLGGKLADIPIQSKLVSPDQKARVTIYDVAFSEETVPYYFSHWQNEDDRPQLFFFFEPFYDELQAEDGYTEIAEE